MYIYIYVYIYILYTSTTNSHHFLDMPKDKSTSHAPKPQDDDTDSISSGLSISSRLSISSMRTSRTIHIQEIVEDSKSKTVKFVHIKEAKLQELAYICDWCKQALALISAYSYYAPILGSDGFSSPHPRPTRINLYIYMRFEKDTTTPSHSNPLLQEVIGKDQVFVRNQNSNHSNDSFHSNTNRSISISIDSTRCSIKEG